MRWHGTLGGCTALSGTHTHTHFPSQALLEVSNEVITPLEWLPPQCSSPLPRISTPEGWYPTSRTFRTPAIMFLMVWWRVAPRVQVFLVQFSTWRRVEPTPSTCNTMVCLTSAQLSLSRRHTLRLLLSYRTTTDDMTRCRGVSHRVTGSAFTITYDYI